MKILLTNFHPGNGGGHTTYLKYLFQELSKLDNIDVYLAVPKSSKLYRLCRELNENNVFDIDFPSKVKELGSVIKNTKKLASLIKKFNFDILHVNGNPEHKMAMYCKIFYGLKFKIIRTKHESKPIKDNFFTNMQYRNFMDGMIIVSNYQLKQIHKDFILNKTHIIHNGVDLDYFSPRKKKQEILTKYNIKGEDIIFVSVAGTDLHKGWQYLVKAASKLESEQNIKIIIAGASPDKYTVNENVNKYGMQDNVIFTGLIDDVRDIINLGDIGFVLSTSIETISFACREMMSMAKPMIVSNYAGLPENVSDGSDGWIVDVKNSNELYNALDTLIQNFNYIDKYSKNAKAKADKEFGLDKFIKKTMEVYNSK